MSDEPDLYSALKVDLKFMMDCLGMLPISRTAERRNYWRNAIIREAESIIDRVDTTWEEEDE
jgi:hypothetical protein